MVETNMDDDILTLLVYDRPDPMESLKQTLKDLRVKTRCVRTCDEAGRLLSQIQTLIVFTDTLLPDGTWNDVIQLAEMSGAAPSVVVVSSDFDLDLYHSALHSGAYDFLFPPFVRPALEFVVQSAARDVLCRQGISLNPGQVLGISRRAIRITDETRRGRLDPVWAKA